MHILGPLYSVHQWLTTLYVDNPPQSQHNHKASSSMCIMGVEVDGIQTKTHNNDNCIKNITLEHCMVLVIIETNT